MEKSRDRRHFYLLKGLLWMDLQGAQHKMAGSSPKTRLRLLANYTTQVKSGGKDVNIQFKGIDQQIPVWLLMVLAKQIIIIRDGQIIDHELLSPFTYLWSIAQGLESPKQLPS